MPKKGNKSKKGFPKQGNRKLKNNLRQPCLEETKHQTELQSMGAAIQKKDGFIKELREDLTKRDDELKKVREVAIEFKDLIFQLQTQNQELQSMASDKLKLMVELENENVTLKRAMKKNGESIEAKEAELLAAKQTISKMEKESAQKSIEEKANIKRISEVFLKRENALQSRLEYGNEEELFNILLKKDIKLYKLNKDFEVAKQIIYCLQEEIETKSVEQNANNEILIQYFQQREKDLVNQNNLLEHDLRNRNETIIRLNEKIVKQAINFDQKIEEEKLSKVIFKEKEQRFKEKEQRFKDEIHNKSKEICLHKKQLEIITSKLERTVHEFDFKRVELDAVASGVKTKLDKLRKADEKLDALNIAYNEKLNPGTKKKKFIFRLCNAFRCCGNKSVVSEST